jgi:hypothetical protein
MDWYAVRCIFENSSRSSFEERIVLWRADTLDHAIEQAERDAEEYARDLDIRYAGLAQAYGPLYDDPDVGVEVFSLMRDSALDAPDYLARFFDTGAERQLSAGE